jgi:hypothetical protein
MQRIRGPIVGIANKLHTSETVTRRIYLFLHLLAYTSHREKPLHIIRKLHKKWAPGTISPRVKRPERENDNSPPSSAEVKKY